MIDNFTFLVKKTEPGLCVCIFFLMKKLFYILCFCAFATVSFSQAGDDNDFMDRLVFGGNIGISMGQTTNIDLSPSVAYKINPRILAGIGITYMYFKDNRPNASFETDIYGGRLFASAVVIDDLSKIGLAPEEVASLYLHAEYERLSLESKYFDINKQYTSSRFYIDNYLVGLGIRYKVGSRTFLKLEALWNLNENSYSLYNNPIIRFGIGF